MKHIPSNLVGAGRVTGADDSGEVQKLQVTESASGSGFADRVLDKVMRIFQFGFTSVPPLNSEVLTLRRKGDRTLTMVIGTSHRPSRPTGLQPGDAAMYDVRGVIIKMTAAGIEIDCQGLPLVVHNTSGMHVEGPIVADGDITGLNTSDALALSQIRTKFNGHDHTGVQPGSGTSAGPTNTL
ncbi:MAG: phage baseplate assembly protein [Methylovirgula sp.]|nr:phage baseplate assembly protein [Methylovirgula sp.]